MLASRKLTSPEQDIGGKTYNRGYSIVPLVDDPFASGAGPGWPEGFVPQNRSVKGERGCFKRAHPIHADEFCMYQYFHRLSCA